MKNYFYIFFMLIFVNNTFAKEESPSKSFFPQQMTAKELLVTCSSSYMTRSGRERKKYCSGFISGVEEATRLHNKQASSPQICLPKGKTSSQYTDIYMNYASRKTTDLSKPAALIVIEALQWAFPCKVTE